jgi:hypothetical protein
VEHLSDYLYRKRRELVLVECCVPNAATVPPPKGVDDVIARKFRAAAALKAAHARSNWQLTETHWAEKSEFHVGPFTVSYNYQRADLAIGGPEIYSVLRERFDYTIIWSGYTSCGMGAVASLAAAYGQICPGGVWVMPCDGYPETRELVSLYGGRFGFVPRSARPNGRAPPVDRRVGQTLFIDSGAATSATPCPLASLGDADLILFDTTCLAVSSGRIAAILHNTSCAGAPVVLLRSHTKLDSLGIEYGRLGSLVIAAPRAASAPRRHLAERLATAANTARRLFGVAALPEHLPPFATGSEWDTLCRLRTARIVRNNRRAARTLAARACPGEQVLLYRHGLFFTIAPRADWDEMVARQMVTSLVQRLYARALPIRHAGSFGFDFAVADVYPAIDGNNFVLRISLADLPDELIDEIVDGIGTWTAATASRARRVRGPVALLSG